MINTLTRPPLNRQLRDDITVKTQEIDKETHRKTKLEKELKQCQVWHNVLPLPHQSCQGEMYRLNCKENVRKLKPSRTSSSDRKKR